MSKGKNKFDLTRLVHHGLLKEGEKLYFLSDEKFVGTIKKMPDHEFKVEYNKEIYTIHALSQKWLGTEPPDHASRWIKNEKGHTLYQIWQKDLEEEAA